MKKQLLSVTLLMSLFAVTPMVYTKSSDNSKECASSSKNKNHVKKEEPKKTHTKVASQEARNNEAYDAGKEKMHKIEKDLTEIQANYKKAKDKSKARSHANKELAEMKARIKAAVASMKKSHEHSAMTQRHEHRLNNQLANVKAVVNKK